MASLTAARLLARFGLVVALFVLLIFVPAGTWRWPEAWVFLAVYLAFAIPVGTWLFRTNPELLARRTDWSQRAPKKWDRVLMAVLAPVWISVYVLAGLDHRHGWSDVPVGLRAAGFVLVAAFFALFARILRENAFLSRVVEVRAEEGHRVVTTGPYAVVRHPMYAGHIVSLVATPLALGSWPALVPAVLLVGGMVVRTVLEDRTLHAELPGYPEYAARVRWRLVPHLF
jgi:protein-S-isoprenylcysteine O-methyltransferase Ste14